MYAFPLQQFGIDHLRQIDLPAPQIISGTVLIRVHAVSLNYRDLMVDKGCAEDTGSKKFCELRREDRNATRPPKNNARTSSERY